MLCSSLRFSMATVEKITLPTSEPTVADGTKVVTTRSSDADISIATEKRGRGSDIALEEGRTEAAKNPEEDDFPDGGLRAWLVVVGVRLSNLCSCCCC